MGENGELPRGVGWSVLCRLIKVAILIRVRWVSAPEGDAQTAVYGVEEVEEVVEVVQSCLFCQHV